MLKIQCKIRYTKECLFECNMGKYSPRPRNKVCAFRRTPYSLERCCIFSISHEKWTTLVFCHTIKSHCFWHTKSAAVVSLAFSLCLWPTNDLQTLTFILQLIYGVVSPKTLHNVGLTLHQRRSRWASHHPTMICNRICCGIAITWWLPS